MGSLRFDAEVKEVAGLCAAEGSPTVIAVEGDVVAEVGRDDAKTIRLTNGEHAVASDREQGVAVSEDEEDLASGTVLVRLPKSKKIKPAA